VELLSASTTNFSTFLGLGAGTSTSATGLNNTGIGYQALQANTTGDYNNAIGYQALFSNTTGYSNNALGDSALYNNVSGFSNTAIGQGALLSNISGDYNTAVGDAALSSTIGSGNTAVGVSALYSNTTGAYNTSFGSNVLSNNTTGYENIAIGGYAANPDGATLDTLTTGAQNIALGAAAGQNLTTGSGNIAIGWNALLPSATVDRQLSIGNLIFGTLPATTSASSLTGFDHSGGRVGIGTTTSYSKLSVWADGSGTGARVFELTDSASTTLFTVNDSGTASTTNLTVSALNAANCDVKASAAGVFSCGTDADSGFAWTPATSWNATSTLLLMTNGLMATASSTIGDGTQAGGLTVSGTATTTNLRVTALTSGRVPYVTTNSQLTDSSSFTFDGTFPLNTSGGQLSVGQAGAAGGFLGLVEAIRQVTGVARDNAVPGARIAAVSGFGMINFDRGLCASAAVLAGASA